MIGTISQSSSSSAGENSAQPPAQRSLITGIRGSGSLAVGRRGVWTRSRIIRATAIRTNDRTKVRVHVVLLSLGGCAEHVEAGVEGGGGRHC